MVISRCFVCSLNFAPNRQRNKAKYDDKNTNAKPGDQRTNKYIKDSLKLLHLMVLPWLVIESDILKSFEDQV